MIQPIAEVPPIAILDLYDSYSIIFAGKGNKVGMLNMGDHEEHFTKVETGWAVTGDNMRVIAHGLHLIMMTDRELCVYDPLTKKIL